MTTTLTTSPTSAGTRHMCGSPACAAWPTLCELTRDELTAALFASPFQPGDLDRCGLDACESYVMQAGIEVGTDEIAHDGTTVAVLYAMDLDTRRATVTDPSGLARLDACRAAAEVIVSARA